MPGVLILAIILFGMVVGAAAQFVLGRDGRGIDWGLALGAGLIGSFVGGLLFSLIAGDGIELRAERADRLVHRRRARHPGVALVAAAQRTCGRAGPPPLTSYEVRRRLMAAQFRRSAWSY